MKYKAEYERLKAYEPAMDILDRLTDALGTITFGQLANNPDMQAITQTYLEAVKFIREFRDEENGDEE